MGFMNSIVHEDSRHLINRKSSSNFKQKKVKLDRNYYENDKEPFKAQNNFYQVVTSRISDNGYEYLRWQNA